MIVFFRSLPLCLVFFVVKIVWCKRRVVSKVSGVKVSGLKFTFAFPPVAQVLTFGFSPKPSTCLYLVLCCVCPPLAQVLTFGPSGFH